MNPSDNDPLLRVILPGDPANDLRASSLEHLLQHARERRQRRDATHSVLSTVVALVTLMSLLVVAREVRRGNLPTSVAANTSPVPSAGESRSTPVIRNGVRMLSDDELLSIFRGQRVALVGQAGTQRLVFLDRQPDETTPPP